MAVKDIDATLMFTIKHRALNLQTSDDTISLSTL